MKETFFRHGNDLLFKSYQLRIFFVIIFSFICNYKNNTKQRFGSIQGLRSLKDTLPKNIKKVINKKGHIYSETLNNWKYIVGENYLKFVIQNHLRIQINLELALY